MAIDRNKMRSAMSEEVEESYQRKDDRGFNFSLLDPEKVRKFNVKEMGKIKEGEHMVTIVPFAAGENHPIKKKGQYTYVLDVWAHGKIGTSGMNLVCPARTYPHKNLRCPICEFVKTLRDDPKFDKDSKDEAVQMMVKKVKDLSASRKVIYNLVVHDTAETRDQGVVVATLSHFSFEQNILAIAKKPRGGGYVPFSSPEENGKEIVFTREGKGQTDTRYKGFQFEDRTEPIPMAWLEAAYCLDDLIRIYTYDELKDLFMVDGVPTFAGSGGSGGEDTDEKDAGAKGRKPAGSFPDPDENGEDGNGEDGNGESDPYADLTREDVLEMKKSDLYTLLEAHPAFKEFDDSGYETFNSLRDAAADVLFPTEKKSKKKAAPVEEENNDGDVPFECPGGGTPGKDLDQLEACPDCKQWDNCFALKKKSRNKTGLGRK